MPKNQNIRKVLVIGSGPIVIGQAAEFDYAGTQACRSLKEEGITVVLVNSNPATIMTDKEIADMVYIEPLTVPTLKKIRHNRRQSGIRSEAQRRANVLGAYRVLSPEGVRGKRILLLDDVLTTGATSGECARMLLTAGAKEVHCAVIAARR